MRFVLDLKDHPTISLAYDEWLERMQNFREQAEFIKKQAETLKTQRQEFHDGFWEMACNYLEANNLMPEEYHEAERSHGLEINEKSRQMFHYDLEERQPKNPFEIIMGMLGQEPPS